MEDEAEVVDEVPTISQFEFLDRIPGAEEVKELLGTLAPVFGVAVADYAEFVIGMPQNKKVKVRQEVNGQMRDVERHFKSTTLYFTVAGRLAMVQAAAEMHEWEVSFEPELNVPPGCPAGMLQMDDRIVYREYMVVTDKDGRVLGSKPGMAWVPSSGGKQAAGSNPYEKVETAARGRAIAAWGFGVLPGSGVASLEEMQGVQQNRRALQQQQPEPEKRMSREDLLAEVATTMEAVRQLRGESSDEMFAKMAAYLVKSFGVEAATEDMGDDGPIVTGIDWSVLKDGQLQLCLNQLNEVRKKIAGASGPV